MCNYFSRKRCVFRMCCKYGHPNRAESICFIRKPLFTGISAMSHCTRKNLFATHPVGNVRMVRAKARPIDVQSCLADGFCLFERVLCSGKPNWRPGGSSATPRERRAGEDRQREVSLAYTPEASAGDYVLVHVGFALSGRRSQSPQDLRRAARNG